MILPRFATGRSAAGRSDPAGHRTGRRGERLAARRLRRTGHRLLDRNVVLGGHEVDLLVLAPDRRTIVLVEVKTRAGPDAAAAVEVHPRQQRALHDAALAVRRRPGLGDRPVRIDLVIVDLPDRGRPRIRHFAGVFERRPAPPR